MASVDIYTRQSCGFCRRATDLLDRENISHRVIDTTAMPHLREEMIERTAGAMTFPQILVDGRPIGGFDQLLELERQGKLNSLLDMEPL